MEASFSCGETGFMMAVDKNAKDEDEEESWEEVSLPLTGDVAAVVDLPSGMTENRAVLDAFFRPEVWEQHASQQLKKRLWVSSILLVLIMRAGAGAGKSFIHVA